MQHSSRGRILIPALFALLLAVAALSAVGFLRRDAEKALSGQVVAVDTATATFRVADAHGVIYQFRMVTGSQGNLAEIKDHQDNRRTIIVHYKGTGPPYEVISAD